MGHRSASSRPALKTLVRVFRGDACAVYDAVRHEARGGLVIPPGSYRYPFATVLELLKLAGRAGHFRGETDTDSVLSADALANDLRVLVPAYSVIGIPFTERLDTASAQLLGGFIRICHLLSSCGLNVPRVVLGTASSPPEALRFRDAEIHEVDRAVMPPPALSSSAEHVHTLLRGAPHPVGEDSLRGVAELPLSELRPALQELAAANLIVVEDRIALGPVSDVGDELADAWLDTAETRLPHARLSCANSSEPELARRLARAALSRGEAAVARACLEAAGLTHCPEFAHALALEGSYEAATALLEELPEGSGGVTPAWLALRGAFSLDRADALLRRRKTFEARAWRARLAMHDGNFRTALNLLQRTSHRQLSELQPSARALHLLTLAKCRLKLRERNSARQILEQARPDCLTGSDRTTWHALHVQAVDEKDESRALKEALENSLLRLDFCSAEEFASRLNPRDVAETWNNLAVKEVSPTRIAGSPERLFARLRNHGATLFACLKGDELLIQPAGAAMQPGLPAKLQVALRRLREYPSATLLRAEEFACAGPFQGNVVIALRDVPGGGPAIILLKGAQLSDERALLAALSEGEDD